MNYKVTSEEADHFVVDDGKGPFKVAKKGLGEGMLKRIQKLARGGVVQKLAPGGFVEDAVAEFGDTALGSALAAYGNQAGGELGVPLQPNKVASYDLDKEKEIAAELGAQKTLEAASGVQPAQTTPPAQAAVGGSGSAGIGLPGGPSKLRLEAAPSTTDLEGAVSDQRAAITEQAQTEAHIANERGKAIADVQARQAKADAAYFGRQKAEEQKLQDLQRQFNSSDVDPKRFWGNAATGDKILAGIGLALGTLAGAGNGGVNPAVKVMTDAIERDVDAQKSNIDKMGRAVGQQQNLLGIMRQNYADEASALAATKATMFDQLNAQLEAAKAKASGPEKILAIEQMQNSVAQEAWKAKQGLAIQVHSAATQDAKLALDRYELGAKLSAAGAGGDPLGAPGFSRTQGAPAIKTEEAAKFRESIAARDSLMQAINKMKELKKDSGAEFGWGDSKAEMDALQADMITALKDMKRLGALDKGTQEISEKLIPGSTDFRGSSLSKLDVLESRANASLASQAKSLGYAANAGTFPIEGSKGTGVKVR